MVSTISSLRLYQILRQKVGEKEAEALVDLVDVKIRENNESNLRTLATKEDINLLKQDILKLENKISETKTDIIKWVFGFFITLVLIILGLYFRK